MKWLGLIITILVIVGGITFIIFHYGNSKPEQYFNVSISANYNNQKIITQIDTGKEKINTSQYYELLSIPEGINTFRNINIPNQNYYENTYSYNITSNQRIDINLDKPEIPEIKIKRLNPMVIELKSQNFKGTKFCLDSSINFVFVNANYTEIKKPENYTNFDSCYGTFNLNGTKDFQINYTALSNPTGDDYLKIVVFDKALNKVIKKLI